MNNSHYFVNDPTLESHPRKIAYEIGGHSFELATDDGVFSKDRLDQGTEILLKTLLPIGLKGKVLDIGCGYGPIGLTLAAISPPLNVTCSDVNTRALALCEKNATSLALSQRVTCLLSDIYTEIEGLYDSIVSNPPIRAGKKVTYAIYIGAKDHLIDGGSLYIVVRKAQGAISVKAYLEEIFPKVEILERSKGYYVLKATKAN